MHREEWFLKKEWEWTKNNNPWVPVITPLINRCWLSPLVEGEVSTGRMGYKVSNYYRQENGLLYSQQ